MGRRLLLACLLGLLAVALGACRADVEVDVGSSADGSGRVRTTLTLDAAAASRLPDLASELRVEDLRQAGWDVDGPTALGGGGVAVTATKGFDSAAALQQVLGEVAGPGGPLRDFRVEHERSFLRTRTAFTGMLDLSAGLEAFSDDDLRARLGGGPLGLTPEQLADRLGAPAEEVFVFRVVADLPGRAKGNGPGGVPEWEARLGEQVVLAAASQSINRANVALAATSVGAALLLAGVLGARLLGRGGGRAVSWS